MTLPLRRALTLSGLVAIYMVPHESQCETVVSRTIIMEWL